MQLKKSAILICSFCSGKLIFILYHMRHCVFCASTKCADAIDRAKWLMNVLAERSEGLNIKAKSLMAGVMEFTNDRQPVVLEVLLVGVIPIAILVIGLVIWIRRKRI